MKPILGMFDRILSTILFIIAIAVIGLYMNTYYFNEGQKGISHKDLSQICIFFCFLYVVKYIIQLLSRKSRNDA